MYFTIAKLHFLNLLPTFSKL